MNYYCFIQTEDREAAEDSGDKDRGRNTGPSDRIHLLRRSDNRGRPLHEGHKAKNRTGLGNVWHNEQGSGQVLWRPHRRRMPDGGDIGIGNPIPGAF